MEDKTDAQKVDFVEQDTVTVDSSVVVGEKSVYNVGRDDTPVVFIFMF